MSLSNLFERIFIENEWRCAYRKLEPGETYPGLKEGKPSYAVVPIPSDHWAADSFVFSKEGQGTYLFFEYYNKKKSKATLAIQRLDLDEIGRPETIYEFPCHTSYPCVFEWEGEIYLIPETIAAHNIQLLRCVSWPNKWQKIGNLLENIDCCDCTFFIDGDFPGLFVYEMDGGTRYLRIAHIDFSACKLNFTGLMKGYDKFHGRPGGKNFVYQEKNVRAVQPCERFYGEKIEYFEFSIGQEFAETKIGQFSVNDLILVNPPRGKLIGIHTINRSQDIEVIDVLFRRFSPFKIIKHLFKKLKLFGYGQFERSGEFLDCRFSK